MKISKIHIENFRSIKSLNLDVPEICCLVGPNNAGKSNILLAVQRVLARDWVSVTSFDELDVYAHEHDSDVTIQIFFEPGIPFARFRGVEPVAIRTLAFEYTRYKVGPDKGRRRLEQKCFDEHGKPPMVLAKVPKKGEKYEYQPLVNIPSDVRESVPLIYIGTNRALKEQLPGARYSMLRQLFEDIDRDLQDPKQTIKVKQQDGSEVEIRRLQRFHALMEAAVNLLRTDSFKALEDSIKKNALQQLGFDPATESDRLDLFFSPFDTMDFYKALDLRVREGAFSVSATEIGEGVQNALVLAILKAFEERRKQGAILLIEEPEMFLHPQMQRSLYKTLREIAKTNQIIYTTHSPHFISIPEYNEVVIVRKGMDGTQVRCSNLPTDAKRREKLIKELDPERNELFFASRLLLVEGDTEKLALPEYAKRLNLDLDRAGATIVEVGGKRNLPEFAQIAASFEIPTGIVYDEDSSDFNDEGEEGKFNAALNGFARRDGTVCVWRFSKKYEDHLRKAVGEKKYQELCQKYSNVGKPTRARLIATEPELPIPEPVPGILSWLANKPSDKAARN
ncbi:MAG: AAA family ATPase [Deltaproteobacteria bacterium]|nr:AAA family ATPase [Deltaproteobacteria bacterium]